MNSVFELLSSPEFNGEKRIHVQKTHSNELFIKHADNSKQVLEVVFDQKQLLKVFLDARKIFQTSQTLTEKYLSSCILMTVTPGNQKCINTHQEVFLQLSQNDISLLRKEVYFVKALLTSYIARVNKSSTCWLWFKKLYLLNPDKHLFLSTVLKSGERHPSNYYCWNFARFLLALNAEDEEFLDHFYRQTQKFCMQHVNDNSAWNFLPLIMTYRVDDFYFREAEGIAAELKIDLRLSSERKRYAATHQRLSDTLLWLSKSGSVSIAALSPLLQLSEAEAFFYSPFFDSVHAFEERYGLIELVNGSYHNGQIDQGNALALEDLKKNGDKKRILQWHLRIKHSLHNRA